MATTTKKPASKPVQDISTKSVESVVDEEKEKMRKELEELKAQMAMMTQMVSNKPEPKESNPNKRITFINMTTGTLVLKGNSIHTLAGQFAEDKYLEREARIIVNNAPNAIRKGYVYIADAEFVKQCELEDVYSTMLNDTQLKTLLQQSPSNVVEIYKSVSDGQKDIIVNMIKTKRYKGEFVDANIMMEIGKLAGEDLIGIEPEKE